MSYAMTLILNNAELPIPVLPEKLEITSPGKNERVTILTLGEVLILRKRGLLGIRWDSHFPLAGTVSPIESVRRIQAAREAERPIRLLLQGTELDINIEVAVNSFDYDERFGAVGEIFYSIELSEYRRHGPTVITIQGVESAQQELFEEDPPRAGEPPEQAAHTVIAGDSLWAIAQKSYGNGGRYPEIYSANQEHIDARNRGTGNSKYTIYPGQVLIIP